MAGILTLESSLNFTGRVYWWIPWMNFRVGLSPRLRKNPKPHPFNAPKLNLLEGF